MKILSIIKKEIKQNLRNISVMLIFTMMPLIIILLLGVAFGSVFSSESLTLNNLNIEYSVTGDPSQLTLALKDMMEEMLDEGDNSFSLSDDRETSLDKLGDNKITCYIEIDEDAQTIKLHKNNLFNTEASMIQGVLNAFVDRYNVIMEIMNVAPEKLGEITSSKTNTSFVSSDSLDHKNKPGAMDYYGITMCTLFVLYGMMTPTTRIIGDRFLGTSDRMLISPVKKGYIFIGKVLGFTGVSIIQIGLVILVSSQVYNVNWGDRPLLALLLVFTEIIMAVSIGTGLGYLFKKEASASAISHMFIVVSAFFGGGYLALEFMGSLSDIGSKFSVLWWNNTGLLNLIYNGETDNLFVAMLINIVVAVVFFSLAILKMNQKEGMGNV